MYGSVARRIDNTVQDRASIIPYSIRYARMDTRGAIQDRASITPYNKFTGRYGTICDGGVTVQEGGARLRAKLRYA